MPIADYLGLSDTVLDLEITPNRPDCLSVTGFAREVGAMYQCDWTDPLPAMAAELQLDATAAPVDETVSVDIEDAARCPRYTARVIRGCKVGPSPDWMVERLAAIGQRSINNIVDVTNYILSCSASRCTRSTWARSWVRTGMRTWWCARPRKARSWSRSTARSARSPPT